MSEQQGEGAADCGATFAHAPHVYRTQRGKAKACDGSTDKRLTTTTSAEGAS